MNLEQILSHAVTEYDRKQSTKRGYNPYALGIYFERVEEVLKDIAAGASPREAVIAGFNDRLRDHILRAMCQPNAPKDVPCGNRPWYYKPVAAKE
jgi:hypothetical protein